MQTNSDLEIALSISFSPNSLSGSCHIYHSMLKTGWVNADIDGCVHNATADNRQQSRSFLNRNNLLCTEFRCNQHVLGLLYAL